MKFVSFDGGKVGVLLGEEIADLSGWPVLGVGQWPPLGMVRLIHQLGTAGATLPDLDGLPHLKLGSVQLEAPIQWPNKVVAFPANFHAHMAEMERIGRISDFPADHQGFFLKSSSSLSGPSDGIELPSVTGREVHHECELAIVIGRGGRDIPREAAMEHVFGYSCLVDVVIRGREERVMRKSYDTFCPIGPWIVTADEIDDPANMALELTVDGALRQQANTRDLVVDVPGMLAMASAVMTLQPGDIIASGTPAGVGPIKDGEILRIAIAGVGEMTLPVRQGQRGRHPVWDKDVVSA